MYIALDSNFTRVHIDDTSIKYEYFCPSCHSPLEVRRGSIRRHHFAHAKKHICSDTWSKDRELNISQWHDE